MTLFTCDESIYSQKEMVCESTERNLKLDWAFTLSRFEGVAINEHFVPKACASTQRGESVRKHAALMAINGSLTVINVKTQRAQHAQANLHVKEPTKKIPCNFPIHKRRNYTGFSYSL